MEVNAGDDLDGDDRGGRPIDYQAEGRPPARVRDELPAVLPKILEPLGTETENE
jgi:hypothetical protein